MLHDDSVPATRVIAALAAIALLAFVLPFGAVRALHGRRLRAVEAELAVLAEQLRTAERNVWPAGVDLLVGPGSLPPARDTRWVNGSTYPLTAASLDPWGNAYLVNLGASRTAAAVWVLSAGPDGIVDTPYLEPVATAQPRGDDRAVRIR